MYKLITVLSLAFSCTSLLTAQSESVTGKPTSGGMIPNPDYQPILETLPTVPRDVPACAFRLAASRDAFGTEKYVFAGNLAEAGQSSGFAFIMMSGTMLRFDRIGVTRIGDHIRIEYESAPYRLFLEYIELLEYGQSVLIDGELTLIDAKGNEIKQPVFGKCGC